jgi:hypothetical protein
MYCTVFGALLKHIPWSVFDRLVDEYQGDKKVRKLSMRDQFTALLYGQLSGAVSLREIVGALESHHQVFKRSHVRPVQRSSLAEANAKRPVAVFAGLFAHLSGRLMRSARRPLSQIVRLMDATHLLRDHKLHLLYDPCVDCPLDPRMGRALIPDLTFAQTMPLEAGATYVFDLGYYDYGFWARVDKHGCRFVTRLKKNTSLRHVHPLPVERQEAQQEAQGASNILSDTIGFLPERLAASRRNPMSQAVREIVVRIETGKTLRLVTNDLDAPAHEIADLYKARWHIELLFKWIKQHLKIKHFLGTSTNAIQIQIYVALIAYVLIRLAKATQTLIKSPLTFIRLIKTNLTHTKTIQNRLKPPQSPSKNLKQMKLNL